MKTYVFISGATGGLGKSFVVENAKRGWDLFLTDLSENALNKLTIGIKNTYGVDVQYYACDLTSQNSREEMYRYLNENNFIFHSLINVAGLDFEGEFLNIDSKNISTIVKVNIESLVDNIHNIIKFRDPYTKFRIINVASLAAFYPMPIKATYAASKRFILNFSLAIREELKDHNCSITILCPSGMPTTPELIKKIEVQGFLGRVTTKNTGFVANKAVKASLKGRVICIPGILNYLLRIISSVIMPTVIAKAINKRWRNAHKRNATSASFAK